MKLTILNNLSISQKLIIFSLALVVLPLSIFATYVFLNYTNYIKDTIHQDMRTSVEEKNKLLHESLNVGIKEAEILALNSDARDTLSYMANGESIEVAEFDRLQNMLKNIMADSGGFYENLFYADTNGYIVIDGINGGSIGTDLNGMDFYEGAKGGELFMGDVMESPITKRPVLCVGVPVHDNAGQIVGQFIAAIEFNKVTEVVIERLQGVNYNYFLVNRDGLFIAHEDSSLVLQYNMAKVKEMEHIYKRMKDGESGIDFYQFQGQDKVMAFAPTSKHGWYVGTAYTVNEYMQPIAEMRKSLILIGTLCLFGAVSAAIIFSRRLAKPIIKMRDIALALANRDLTQNVDYTAGDEIGQMANSINQAVNSLRTMFRDIILKAEGVRANSQELAAITEESASNSQQIASTVDNLAVVASTQAEEIEEGSAAIQEMASSFEVILGQTSDAMKAVEKARDLSGKGLGVGSYQKQKMNENIEAAEKVMAAIQQLAGRAEDIVKIVQTIHAISNQINLLALNAAIEAARAGEHGQGFAVVAAEVRTLATQTEEATEQVSHIMQQINVNIGHAVKEMQLAGKIVSDQEVAVNNSTQMFNEIDQQVREITQRISDIVEANTQNVKTVEALVQMVQTLSSSAEEAAASTEEVSASSEEQTASIEQVASSAGKLAELAIGLNKIVEEFKI